MMPLVYSGSANPYYIVFRTQQVGTWNLRGLLATWCDMRPVTLHYFIAFILLLSLCSSFTKTFLLPKFSSSFLSTSSPFPFFFSLSLYHYPMSNPSTNGELTSPLLSTSDVILTISDSTANGHSVTTSPPPNPFDFLGASPLEIPPPSPIDPFRNHTLGIRGLYEWCKILICLPIAALRLALFGLSLAVGYAVTWVALRGWKDVSSPLTPWRRRLMWVTRISARCILFSFG